MKQTYHINDMPSYERAIDAINAMPWGYVITIDDVPPKETRRTAQNRLLWLWNGELQKHMVEIQGIVATSEQLHEVMCKKLRPVTIAGHFDGEPILQRFQTSKATVQEMAAYLTDYEQYCAEYLNLLLPLPDDLRMAVYGERVRC